MTKPNEWVLCVWKFCEPKNIEEYVCKLVFVAQMYCKKKKIAAPIYSLLWLREDQKEDQRNILCRVQLFGLNKKRWVWQPSHSTFQHSVKHDGGSIPIWIVLLPLDQDNLPSLMDLPILRKNVKVTVCELKHNRKWIAQSTMRTTFDTQNLPQNGRSRWHVLFTTAQSKSWSYSHRNTVKGPEASIPGLKLFCEE